jgi:hypothetical protein
MADGYSQDQYIVAAAASRRVTERQLDRNHRRSGKIAAQHLAAAE